MGKQQIALRAQHLRQQIESDIERLIGLLDALDGDPDREASLAGFNPISWYSGQDVDLEGDFSDYEPSLGWAERRA